MLIVAVMSSDEVDCLVLLVVMAPSLMLSSATAQALEVLAAVVDWDVSSVVAVAH
jgi:hypothetical protein